MSILEWQGNKNYIDETETISDCLAVTVHHTFFCELSFGMIVPVNSAVVIIELEVINFTENFMTPSLVFFSVSKYLSESCVKMSSGSLSIFRAKVLPEKFKFIFLPNVWTEASLKKLFWAASTSVITNFCALLKNELNKKTTRGITTFFNFLLC